MKPSYFVISKSKNDLISDKSIHVVDASSCTKNNDNCNEIFEPSGVVAQLLCKIDVNRGSTGWA